MELPKEIPKKILRELPEEIPKAILEELPKTNPALIFGGITWRIFRRIYLKELPGGISGGGIISEESDNSWRDFQKNSHNNFWKNYRQNSGDFLAKICKEFLNEFIEKFPEKFLEYFSGEISGGIPW